MTENHDKYDIIGDIHGHAATLRALLAKLGYIERKGVYRRPDRRVIFVGDFIDRGPKIFETLQIVHAMVEAGSALAVVGNHEFNAIRYHTTVNGEPIRPHNETDENHKHYKNFKQHRATLEQVARPYPEDWARWLEWFKSLPLYLDLGGLRVVHAAWCEASIRFLGNRRFNDTRLLIAASRPGTNEYDAVGALVNGPELALPEVCLFHDKEGIARDKIRSKWFGLHPNGDAPTYRSLVMPPGDEAPDLEVNTAELATLPSYGDQEPPVVFGHYWMPPSTPRCLARNVVCADYSVASKDGVLAAYRWNAEAELSDANFVVQPRL